MPVGLYGDETKFGTHESQDKLTGIFLNLVLFRPKSIRLSRFLVFAIRSNHVAGPETFYPVLARLTWSLGWAAKGLWPRTNMDGSSLPCNGPAALTKAHLTFRVTELRGDLAWHKFIWNLSSGWTSSEVCFFCQARSSGRHSLCCHVHGSFCAN